MKKKMIVVAMIAGVIAAVVAILHNQKKEDPFADIDELFGGDFDYDDDYDEQHAAEN